MYIWYIRQVFLSLFSADGFATIYIYRYVFYCIKDGDGNIARLPRRSILVRVSRGGNAIPRIFSRCALSVFFCGCAFVLGCVYVMYRGGASIRRLLGTKRCSVIGEAVGIVIKYWSCDISGSLHRISFTRSYTGYMLCVVFILTEALITWILHIWYECIQISIWNVLILAKYKISFVGKMIVRRE